jgi:hypothetical protein
MPPWICPKCDREFGRARQPHVCVPGGTVDETFAGRPEVQRRIYDAVIQYVRSLGSVHEDAVSVGVFLKRPRTFVQVRPRSRDVVLFLWLPRQVEDPRIGRVRLRIHMITTCAHEWVVAATDSWARPGIMTLLGGS